MLIGGPLGTFATKSAKSDPEQAQYAPLPHQHRRVTKAGGKPRQKPMEYSTVGVDLQKPDIDCVARVFRLSISAKIPIQYPLIPRQSRLLQ
jgi:hypothetical protein